jgi:sialic acid synthase SpsE
MPLTIVAEIGSNWIRPTPKESLEAAADCVRQAAWCGATAVKFQLFRAESLYSITRARKQYLAVQRLELPIEWLGELRSLADREGLEFWVTPFSPLLATLASEHADVLKIASGDLTNVDLLEAVASLSSGRQIAVSTGAATQDEVMEAMSRLRDARLGGPHPVILMYCVSCYPAKATDYQLDRFPYSDMAVRIGVSDHTTRLGLVHEAIDLGYTVFEKHFMLDDDPEGLPDACVSMLPREFRDYCEIAREYFCERYRNGFGERADLDERVWARRGADGLRPNEEEER